MPEPGPTDWAWSCGAPDLRVVELFARLPAHVLHRPWERKRLGRRALAGILPDRTRLAPRRGSLLPLGLRLLDDSAATVDALLGSRDAEWHRWVRRSWIASTLKKLRQERRDGFEWVVLWRCLSFELWRIARSSEPRNPKRNLPEA